MNNTKELLKSKGYYLCFCEKHVFDLNRQMFITYREGVNRLKRKSKSKVQKPKRVVKSDTKKRKRIKRKKSSFGFFEE